MSSEHALRTAVLRSSRSVVLILVLKRVVVIRPVLVGE
jgi:hypothetical protein